MTLSSVETRILQLLLKRTSMSEDKVSAGMKDIAASNVHLSLQFLIARNLIKQYDDWFSLTTEGFQQASPRR